MQVQKAVIYYSRFILIPVLHFASTAVITLRDSKVGGAGREQLNAIGLTISEVFTFLHCLSRTQSLTPLKQRVIIKFQSSCQHNYISTRIRIKEDEQKVQSHVKHIVEEKVDCCSCLQRCFSSDG